MLIIQHLALKTLLGSVHGKLLKFGHRLEQTSIGQACVAVGEKAERMLGNAAASAGAGSAGAAGLKGNRHGGGLVGALGSSGNAGARAAGGDGR